MQLSVGAVIKALIHTLCAVIHSLKPRLQGPVCVRIIGLPVNDNRSKDPLSAVRVMYIPGIPNPADSLEHHAVGIEVINPADRLPILHSLHCDLTLTHQTITVKIVRMMCISGTHAILADAVHKGLKPADSPPGFRVRIIPIGSNGDPPLLHHTVGVEVIPALHTVSHYILPAFCQSSPP